MRELAKKRAQRRLGVTPTQGIAEPESAPVDPEEVSPRREDESL